MPGKFINEINSDKPEKTDLSIFFDKSKNTTAQSSLVDIVAAGLDLTSGKAGEAPVVVEVTNPDGTKTQSLGWGKTGSSAGTLPARPSNATDLIITHDPASGTDGAATPAQVLTAGLPAGGNAGDALTLTASGLAWGSSLPASTTGDKGKQLTVQADGKVAWSSDSSDLPAYTVVDAGKQLTVKADGTAVEWVADAAEIPAFTIAEAGKHLTVKADGKTVYWSGQELPVFIGAVHKGLQLTVHPDGKLAWDREIPAPASSNALDALQIKADKSGVEWTSSVNMATNLKGGYTAGAFFPVNDQKTNTTRFVDAPTFRHLAGVPEGYTFDQWTPTNRQTGEYWPEFQLAVTRMNAEARSSFGIGQGEPKSPDPAAVWPGSYYGFGGVLLLNGKIFVPSSNGSTQIDQSGRIYDPETDALTLTSGSTFESTSSGTCGGVLMNDGRVFCTPDQSSKARIYDPITNSVSISAATFTGGTNNSMFRSAVLMSDGKVFLVPYLSTTALIYDPATDSVSTPAGAYPGAPGAFWGGVLLPDKRIFCVPYNATQAYIYDPTAGTITKTSPGSFPGAAGFIGGVLMPDGRVFCVPSSATNAKIYDPLTNSVSTVSHNFGGNNNFRTGKLLPSGKVFLCPLASTLAKVYDPSDGSVTTLPGTHPGANAYQGCVLLPSGDVFLVPCTARAGRILNTGFGKKISLNYCASPYYNKL